jgi:hypothetical protein
VRGADVTLAFLGSHELGIPEQHVALRGTLGLPEGGRARASLCRTPKGLFLVAAKNRDAGVVVDLLARDDFRYEPGTLGDRMRVGDADLTVPATHRRQARLCVGLARLARSARPHGHLPRGGRHVAPIGALERAFLDGFLQADELLLAWQAMDRDAPLKSEIAPGISGAAHFLMSDRRSVRVVLSALGDVRVEPLEGVRFSLDESLGGTDLLAGRLRFRLQRAELELWQEIVEALELPAAARLRAVARANFIGRADPEALRLSRALLDRGTRDGDPLATAAAFMVSSELGEPNPAAPEIDGAVSALETHHVPGDGLARLWDEWHFSPEPARVLLGELGRHGDRAEPWALALHERLHARLRILRRDPKRIARADVDLAEHLIRAGNRERARSLLEARLSELPNEEIEDLVPKDDADLTAGAGGQTYRIRVFELLAEARRTSQGPDLRAMAELARLEPLVTSRVRKLAEHAEGGLRARAEGVLRVLEPGGLSRASAERAPGSGLELPNPLSQELIRDLLPHPAAREGSAFVGKIQTLVAAVPAPDHRVLLEYVEPISVARQPEAARALAAAARMLKSDGVQGFVSRGKKGVGFRAYDGPPPFVLVGGRHLDEDSEFGMTADELAFAIATEVAHLCFGHARVTSNEVWSGVFERSKQGLDFLLDVLPLFKGYRIAERAYQLLARVPQRPIKRLVGSARAARKRWASRPDLATENSSDDLLSTVHEDLVAAARVMQLTADRAGLILTDNLAAAVRAMFLVRRDHHDELALANSDGMDALLARRLPDGQMEHQNLAVRIAALISFYLSDDYARLRTALTG